jgi:hypothetical protein
MNTIATQTTNEHSGQTQRVTGFGMNAVTLDVCIILDATGSMAYCLEGVKRALQELLQVFAKAEMNANLGLVVFRDETYNESPKLYSLGTPVEKLQSTLASTKAYGGGDDPESSLLAIKHALSLSGYRSDARKVLFLVTDAPPHDPEAGVSSQNILNLLKSQNVLLFGCTPLIEPYKMLVNATQGTLFELRSDFGPDAFKDITLVFGHKTVKTVRDMAGTDLSVMREEMRKTMRLDH